MSDRAGRRVAPNEVLVTLGMCLSLVALVVGALVVYKVSGPNGPRLTAKLLVAGIAVSFAAVGALVLLGLAFLRSSANRKVQFWTPAVANLVVGVICILATELALRGLARYDPLGVRIGSTVLVPYDWKRIADTNRAYLARSRSPESYFVEDTLLGWTIAPNRESADGMYRSSAAGTRSERRGQQLDATQTRRGVALFGDSFTMSLEVPFDQSFAHYLGLRLPPSTPVVNFGVDGYGVDQAYLHFLRDAAPWSPRVAVLSFIQDDLFRSVSVYPFLRGWAKPFSRPRFVIEAGKLTLLNVPNLSPDTVFSRSSIWKLPLLDHDINFFPETWTEHAIYASYLARFIAAAYPRWPGQNALTTSDAVLDLGTALVEEFVRVARARGTQPVVVYLPSRNDFSTRLPLLKVALGKALAAKGITLNDMTPCLTEHLSTEQLFPAGGGHYTGAGNDTLAACVLPLVAKFL